MARSALYHFATFFALFLGLSGFTRAEDNDQPDQIDEADSTSISYSFSGEVATVSKYIWRGQRLTDGWSLQPAATVGIGGFSFNFWSTIDLTAVNEGDALFLPENPAAPPGDHNGMKGQFSEIDLTFSYALEAGPASLDMGAIVYTFPNRTASLPSTVELYGGASFGDVFLSPGATLYIDVDETGKSGSTGLYFLMDAGHMFLIGVPKFPVLELSGSLSVVNSGFSQFYYGISESGFHDASVSLSAPIILGEHWSLSPFITYSALLGEFRDHQFRNPRQAYSPGRYSMKPF